VIFFLITILLETFLGLEPCLVNVFLNVNHEFEDLFEHVLEHSDILLCKTWLTFNQSDNKLKRLLSD
jgi:hypothetical protein